VKSGWKELGNFQFGQKKKMKEKTHTCQAWWCTPLILTLGRLRYKDCRFKASVDYIASSRPAWVGLHNETLMKGKDKRRRRTRRRRREEG
jgi:hypothetical protein